MISDNPDMAAAQQQRMRDSLRLLETKRRNSIETLKKLHQLYQRLLRHHELDIELDEHNSRLFALTKKFATMQKEAEEMERFETFESIITPFLRMKMLENEAEENRRAGNVQEQKIREIADSIEVQKKRLGELRDENREADIFSRDLQRQLCRASNYDGRREQLDGTLKYVQELIDKGETYRKELVAKSNEIEAQLEGCGKKLSDYLGEMHTLESHSQMLEDAEDVFALLSRFEELAEDRRINRERREQALREQTQQNDLLGRVYGEYTDISQQIDGAQDEIGVHRTNIRGMQSYNVQERAIKLKIRLQMLGSAKSLWRRIATGYHTIGEKTRRITELSQQIEYGLRTERELTAKVQHLQQQVDDMRYSLDMSKSQNVIGLRQDLKEGSACTVCGATHHPYHCDTMLDQSKLIGDMRGEYETNLLELQGLKKQLEQLHDELTRAKGEMASELQNLEGVRLRQEEDVREWHVFDDLDPTFRQCDGDIDGDARMATLRQLIDNAERDEQQARAELDEFNYHSNQIDVISEKISKLEERKDELTTRMGEVNTACQVLASQLESINGVLKTIEERYHQIYNQLMAVVSLPDWYEAWKQSPESVNIQLRGMYKKWSGLRDSIAEKEKEKNELELKSELIGEVIEHVSAYLETLNESCRSMSDGVDELKEQREQLISDDDVSERLEGDIRRMESLRKQLAEMTEEVMSLTLEQKKQEGVHENVLKTGELLDERASSQRSQVDEWMHAYNAQNPPVQYAELTDVLTADMDWNERRTLIRENRLQTALEEQRVKALQAEIVAIEVDTGTIPSTEIASHKNQTDMQIKECEQQLREVDMQIARLEVELMG